MWRRTFKALSLPVEIQGELPALDAELEARFATYPEAKKPRVVYRVGDGLWRDDVAVYEPGQPLDALAALELDLFQRAAAACTETCALHAAALAQAGRVLLLVGPSGAGKSTLAAALVSRGADYLSDELVSVDAAGRVLGLRRPIGFDRAPDLAGLTGHTIHGRREDGSATESVVVHPPRERLGDAGAVGGIVLLSYAPTQPALRVALSPGEALAALWPHALTQHAPALSTLEALVASVPAFRLTTRAVAEACHMLPW